MKKLAQSNTRRTWFMLNKKREEELQANLNKKSQNAPIKQGHQKQDDRRDP